VSLCQGSAAQALGLLEALTDSNRRTLLSAAPVPADISDTEMLDVYAELFTAAQEIISGQFHSFMTERSQTLMAAWLSGNALVLINIVALRRARLVLGWVTVHGYTILVFNQIHAGLLSLAIHPWVGAMSTGGGLGHR